MTPSGQVPEWTNLIKLAINIWILVINKKKKPHLDIVEEMKESLNHRGSMLGAIRKLEHPTGHVSCSRSGAKVTGLMVYLARQVRYKYI